MVAVVRCRGCDAWVPIESDGLVRLVFGAVGLLTLAYVHEVCMHRAGAWVRARWPLAPGIALLQVGA